MHIYACIQQQLGSQIPTNLLTKDVYTDVLGCVLTTTTNTSVSSLIQHELTHTCIYTYNLRNFVAEDCFEHLLPTFNSCEFMYTRSHIRTYILCIEKKMFNYSK